MSRHMSHVETNSVRAAALAGAAVTAALAAWVLGSTRVALTEGSNAATALAAGNLALVWSQVLSMLLIGIAAVTGLSLRERVASLLALAAAPLPITGILLAVGAVEVIDLVLGQTAVVLCAVVIALAGNGAERLVHPASRWLTPTLQVALLGVALLVQHVLREVS